MLYEKVNFKVVYDFVCTMNWEWKWNSCRLSEYKTTYLECQSTYEQMQKYLNLNLLGEINISHNWMMKLIF